MNKRKSYTEVDDDEKDLRNAENATSVISSKNGATRELFYPIKMTSSDIQKELEPDNDTGAIPRKLLSTRMAKRLAQLIFISVVCLLIIFILLRLHFWSATFIEEPHLWRNLNGLSMARANELFMDCCRATRIPQPCWKYCKYNIDSVS
uniref:Uncharacterized protein n=1 Tax=Romanomermis culicivorax TaxID=13658 RepID=A0A915HTI7_ROMCU